MRETPPSKYSFVPDHPDQCSMATWLTPDAVEPISRCPSSAELIRVYGCVHEHLIYTPLCRRHASEMDRLADHWGCNLCWDATGEQIFLIIVSELNHPKIGADRDQTPHR